MGVGQFYGGKFTRGDSPGDNSPGGNSPGCNSPDFNSIYQESYDIHAIQCIPKGKME